MRYWAWNTGYINGICGKLLYCISGKVLEPKTPKSDLEQRQERIERQDNMFPEIEVYRYVTEQTDAYLY